MAFTPTDYPGLFLWLKADALVLSDTDPVSSWTDSSGRDHHATQATGANQPLYRINQINGQPALDFDGTNDALATAAIDLTNREGVTLYVVAQTDSITTDQILLETTANYNSNAGGILGGFLDSTTGVYSSGLHNGGGTGTWENWTEPSTNAAIITARANKGVSRACVTNFVNGHNLGTYLGDAKNITTSRFLTNAIWNIGARAGTSLFFNGRIAEIIAYWQLHDPVRRVAVESYLAAKYGISVVTPDVAAVYDGHSHTEADSTVTPSLRRWWLRGMNRVTATFDWVMLAKSGTTLEKFHDDKGMADRWLESAIPKRIIANQCGTNDLYYSYSTAVTEDHYQQNWDAMLASNANYRTTRTIMDNNGPAKPVTWDAAQDVVNAWVRANVPAGMTLLDFQAIPELGADGAADNATWFEADKTHVTQNPGETVCGDVWTDYLVDTVGLTEWSPALLSGCVLWLDAHAITGKSDGDPIASWTDRSGSGNHAAQASGTRQPLYKVNVMGYATLPALLFDGTDDELLTPAVDLTGTSALTAFVVATATDNTTDYMWWALGSTWFSGTTGAAMYRRGSDKKAVAYLKGDVGSSTRASAPTATTTPGLLATIFDKSQVANRELLARYNGTQIANSGSSNNTNAFANATMGIGGHGATYLSGYIGEVLVLNRRLTVTEYRRVEAYLANKWRLF